MRDRDSYQIIGVLLIALAVLIGAQFFALDLPVSAIEQPVRALRLMTDQSADETLSSELRSGDVSRCRETAVYVDWKTGVTSGAVEVETAVGDGYGGTWASLAVVTFAGTAPNQDVVQVTGVHWNLRARIDTVILGGLADVWAVCN